ncbi:MAG: tRNA lysidine(34) synthetase TilS [Verrucomicrobiota bacterium]|nr:tRNA lysidine(34) synthetase TilS [Verrucomicrobiota bacterium]
MGKKVVWAVKKMCRVLWDGKSPLLLGYSGGPDSKALLYALLEAGCHTLQVAHVDHGWREESRQESEALCLEVQKLGIPFYSTRLQEVPLRNREEAARVERFKFFRTVAPFGCQAIVLAHRAEDVAETVLKRLLEGAHLPFLGGMEEVSLQQEGPPLWRPLLSVKREEILSFLKKRSLPFFQDPTNLDPAYLRGRMRQTLFPTLREGFGKNFFDNLLLLSERAFSLRAYLERRIDKVVAQRESCGYSVDLKDLDPFEARYWIQKKSKEYGMRVSRDLLDQVVSAIFSRKTKAFLPYFQVRKGVLVLLIII